MYLFYMLGEKYNNDIYYMSRYKLKITAHTACIYKINFVFSFFGCEARVLSPIDLDSDTDREKRVLCPCEAANIVVSVCDKPLAATARRPLRNFGLLPTSSGL